MQAGAPNIVPKWQSNNKYRTQLGFNATGTKADDAVFQDETKRREIATFVKISRQSWEESTRG